MRKLLIIILLALFVCRVEGQELYVKSFVAAQADLSAQTQPRKD